MSLEHPAHAEFARIVQGLARRTLPTDVLSVMHAARRVANAAEPLPEAVEVLVGRCTTWEALVDLAASMEVGRL